MLLLSRLNIIDKLPPLPKGFRYPSSGGAGSFLRVPVMEAEPMAMRTGILHEGRADSIVIGFHSWIFIQCKESVDANSELFKETDDAALDKNTYEIRFCE